MLRQIWQWLKRFWRRVLIKKPTSAPVEVKPARRLTDAEYEALFFRLLAEVEQGLTRVGVKGLLAVNGVTEAELIIWLRGFGERLLVADTPNQELGRRLVLLRDLGMDLGEVAYQIGVQLQPEETNDVSIPEQLGDQGNEVVELQREERNDVSASEEIAEVGEAETCFNQGITWSNLGLYEQAITSFDEAIKIQPDYPDAWRNRGNALRNLGRYEEANISFDQVFNQVLKSQTNHVVWLNQGIALSKLGRHEEAIAAFDQAIQIKPDDSEAWYSKGLALSYLEKNEQALTCFNRALNLKSDYYQAWNNKGRILDKLGQYKEAMASYKQALRYKLDDHIAWRNYGLSLHELGQSEEAILFFNKALEFKQDYCEAWFDKGRVLDKLGQYKEAILCFNQALKFNPEYYQALNKKGVALNHLGKYEEAILSFNQALKFNPEYYEIWYNQGMAFSHLSQYKEALIAFNQAVKLQPEYFELWYNQGLALSHLGQYEETIYSFDQALKLKLDIHDAWIGRGIALSRLGKKEEGISSFDKALEIKPDLHEAWLNRGVTAGQSRGHDPFLSSSSTVVRRNPDLNQRGYDGKLASYEEGLKYCPQAEGQGLLHREIANAHYFQGLSQRHRRTYYRKAVKSYNESLKFLTVADFPQLRLEVLRDLIRVHLHLGESTEAQELQRLGTDLLRRLLDECQNPTQKKQLTLKFVSFQQFTVDLAVQSGNWCAALELAEEGKNACLGWLLLPDLLEDSTSEPHQPRLAQIQQLLNPTTAIVYWHLSPYALHTFILTHNKPPVIVQTSNQRLQQFETWTKTWNEEYSKHRKGKDSLPEAQPTWRDNLPSTLQKLRKILDIAAIVNIINDQESNSIQNLILIPHRDLHLFPLHAIFGSGKEVVIFVFSILIQSGLYQLASLFLQDYPIFPDNFTITYLPSAQIGINLKKFNPNLTPINQLPILSIENPENEYDIIPQADIESAAINQLFPISQQLAEKEATKQEVINALQNNHGILHFTGHGFYNFNNPLKSALALSGEDLLTLEEIYNIPNLNKYQLVTLSACETAITNQQTITTEYVGLVSAFLAQGVNTVISTLWTVTDESSGFFMVYFYWQLKKGKPPAIALKKSQKWLSNLTFAKLERIYKLIFPKLPREEEQLEQLRSFIRRYINTAIPSMSIAEKQKKLYANPYYWAGFTITGF